MYRNELGVEAASRATVEATVNRICERKFREVQGNTAKDERNVAAALVAAKARSRSPPDPQTTNTEVLRPPGYTDQDTGLPVNPIAIVRACMGVGVGVGATSKRACVGKETDYESSRFKM